MSSKKKSKHTPSSVEVKKVKKYIENQPEDVQEKIKNELIAEHVESVSYSGPIPHPQFLREFNEIIPNGADRIMKMAESQSEHRIALEKQIVKASNRDSLLGVIFGGIVAILIVLGSMLLIYTDKDIQGFVLLIGASVGFVGLFLNGRNKDDKEEG